MGTDTGTDKRAEKNEKVYVVDCFAGLNRRLIFMKGYIVICFLVLTKLCRNLSTLCGSVVILRRAGTPNPGVKLDIFNAIKNRE